MTASTHPTVWERSKQIDPRYLIAFLITLVLAVGQLRYHMVGGYDRLALALITCTLTEALLSWFTRGKVVNLQSAYISGLSLTLLIKPQGGALWPFALGGFLAIASKYVLRYRDNHLWNPTNFAIATLLLASPDRVSVLSHQFGNDVVTNLVIWGFGLVIAARVGVLHITLTYIASFLVLNSARAALLGLPVLPEIAPITGPMYQLFIFFMITDPKTTVRSKTGQCIVAFAVASLEMVLRLAQNVYAPYYALFIVGPIALLIEMWLAWYRARRAAAGASDVRAVR
jgi:enediyne biosynthesis protein E5